MKQIFRNMKPMFLILLIPLISWGLSYYRSEKRIQNRKFTVGEITSEWHPKSTFKNFGVDYTYSVNGEKFIKQISENLNLGSKYLVVYDSLNSKNAILISEYDMNIYQYPKNGWNTNEVPIKINLELIKSKY